MILKCKKQDHHLSWACQRCQNCLIESDRLISFTFTLMDSQQGPDSDCPSIKNIAYCIKMSYCNAISGTNGTIQYASIEHKML